MPAYFQGEGREQKKAAACHQGVWESASTCSGVHPDGRVGLLQKEGKGSTEVASFFGRCTALSMFVEFLATSAARNWMCWLEMGGNKFFMSSCLQSISEPREKVTFSLIIKSCSVLCFLKSSGFGDCKDWEKPAISVAVRDVILKREELQSSSSWVPTPLPFHSNNCFLFFSCSLSSYEIGPNCSTFCSVT